MGWDNFRHTVIGIIAVVSLVSFCIGITLQLFGVVGPIGAIEYSPHFVLR